MQTYQNADLFWDCGVTTQIALIFYGTSDPNSRLLGKAIVRDAVLGIASILNGLVLLLVWIAVLVAARRHGNNEREQNGQA
jgi:hypothetical protein